MQRFVALWAAFALVTGVAVADAQEATPSGVYLIYDASNSMWGELPDKSRKYAVARKVLDDFLGQEFAGRVTALRIYGHNNKSDCQDTQLMVPFAAAAENANAMRTAIESARPTGKTPITQSLRAARQDFGDRGGDILLITDGIETCDIDPCDLVAAWRDARIGLRVHVVGLGLDADVKSAMSCVAETSGGRYADADSADSLTAALNTVRSAALAPAQPEAPTTETATSEPDADTGADTGAAEQADVTTAAAMTETAPTEPSRLKLVVLDQDGRRYFDVAALIKTEGRAQYKLALFGDNEVAPGDHQITVGIRTADGSLYAPVTQTVAVRRPGVTTAYMKVKRPPTVSARFVKDGADTPGAKITAYKDGERAFRFDPAETVYAAPGDYEFRAQPDANNDLTVAATLEPTTDARLTFDVIDPVQVAFAYKLSGGETVLRDTELWQGGEKIYGVAAEGGGPVMPGVYDLVALDKLAPYAIDKIEVKNEPDQTLELPVDVGYVIVWYDPSGIYKRAPARAFIRAESQKGLSGEITPDTPLALLPGEYTVQGWSLAGTFAPVKVSVGVGETVSVGLKPTRD